MQLLYHHIFYCITYAVILIMPYLSRGAVGVGKSQRLETDRSREAVVIFLFGLEALFTRDSRVLSCAVSSSPKLWAAIGYYSDQTQFLLAPIASRPVSNPLLSTCGPWENTVLLKYRHPHCIALSFYIISMGKS
jgi:hypothetical protein